MWVSWICLFLLSYPQPDFHGEHSERRRDVSHRPQRLHLHRSLMAVLGVPGIRQGQRVQIHQRRLPKTSAPSAASSALLGGLGGFVLPIMFGALMDITGVRSSAFMLMYGVVWVSLIWMYWTEVRRTEVMNPRSSSAGVK